MKTPISYLPILQNKLSPNVARFFVNKTSEEKLVPEKWWRRQFKKEYSSVLSKETLEDFIQKNKFSIYNKNPTQEIHFMQRSLPILQMSVAIAVVILCWNVTQKIKIIVID